MLHTLSLGVSAVGNPLGVLATCLSALRPRFIIIACSLRPSVSTASLPLSSGRMLGAVLSDAVLPLRGRSAWATAWALDCVVHPRATPSAGLCTLGAGSAEVALASRRTLPIEAAW